MPKSKSSVPRKKYVKKILKKAKGYYGKRKNIFSIAHQSVIRSGMFSFAHRRKKKGDFRALWNVRIGAALAGSGFSYSRFIHALKVSNVNLNRKMLAELAARDIDTFNAVVETVKSKAS